MVAFHDKEASCTVLHRVVVADVRADGDAADSRYSDLVDSLLDMVAAASWDDDHDAGGVVDGAGDEERLGGKDVVESHVRDEGGLRRTRSLGSKEVVRRVLCSSGTAHLVLAADPFHFRVGVGTGSGCCVQCSSMEVLTCWLHWTCSG
jgi:hypothetical protein